MRDPILIAKQMSDEIDPQHKHIFLKLSEDFKYKAPEQIIQCFGELFTTLTELIIEENGNDGRPVSDSEFKVCSILSEKTVEDLKSHYN